ncbi:MAG: DegT/DnrJ/EryC1/StrS aminotransferase family protein [Ornithinimicrobium sp.]
MSTVTRVGEDTERLRPGPVRADRVDGETLPAPATTIPFTRTQICPAAMDAALSVLQSGWVTTGPQVAIFEHELARGVHAPRAVAVSSCTAAIELALRGLRLPEGSPVLVSANTFCGAIGAILSADLTPVLVDVDPLTGTPSEATTAAAAADLVGPTAMLVVHLAGYPADSAALAAAARIGLDMVVEDAAHALGTWVRDRPVGNLCRATCFSFYATKNLAIGEGGMLTTADDRLADDATRARLHGMSRDAWRRYLPGGNWRYDVAEHGLKANMTDLQAAIGRAQLADFDRVQTRRRAVAHRYSTHLAEVPGLTLPREPLAGRHAWHLYAVRVGPAYGIGRDELIEQLGRRGISTSVHFIPAHRLTYYGSACASPAGGLPGADAVFAQTLSLPLDAVISDMEIDTVAGALEEIGTR